MRPRLIALLRRHGLFVTALGLGVALRVVVALAYTPALIFPDTREYLANASALTLGTERPSGYSLFLWPFVHLTSSLTPVEVVQQVLVLGVTVLCYAFLLRRELPRWGATLAVLPLLLDPLQLVLEAYVLSDVLFEVLLVGGCLLVLWRHRPGVPALVAAGVLVGSSAFVRGAGSFVLVAFVVALVCLRVHWAKLVAFLVAALVPIAVYATAFHAQHGEWAITTSGARFLYGRLGPIMTCQDPQLRLPAYERVLCPVHPVGQRHLPGWYIRNKHSPAFQVHGPGGLDQEEVVKDFDRRVVRAEPRLFTAAVLTAFGRGFDPVRTRDVPGHPAAYWLFSDHYWTLDRFIARGMVSPKLLAGTGSRPGPADFLTSYRTWVYTPGPLLAALLLAGVAATLGLGRARGSGNRVATGLLTATCLLPLLTTAALSGFSWRYQLPQIALLPLAGSLGVTALVRRRSGPPPDPSVERRSVLPVPARALAGTGWAAVAGTVCGAGAVLSGWFRADTAALTGLVVGAIVAAMVLGSRPRR